MMYISLRNPMKFLKVIFNLKWSTNLVIFLVMQHIENSMSMIWKPGLFGGRIRLDNSGFKKVPAYIGVGQQVMEEYARKASGIAQNIILEVMFDRPTTAHILGGCVIGENQGEGVVDKDQQVFGYQNLYVCDGSAISSNPGVNPALTITAMTERVMSKIPGKK